MHDGLRRMTNTHGPGTQMSSGARRQSESGTSRVQTRNLQGARTMYERYLTLARAKALAGDRIEAENYYQHADHYLRSIGEDAI
jgi:Domain of unknown function (DUF4167)